MQLPTAARALPLLVLVLGALIAGCGSDRTAGEGRLSVVTSFYPLHFVAERVVARHAEVVGLTPPGAEPHDLELTVAQSADIAEADVILYQRGFQPAVDDAVEQSGPDHTVDASALLGLGDRDPHFWLDPLALGRVAKAFTKEMMTVDPGHAKDYRANLAALEEDLADLDRDYRRGLYHCEVDTVVVSHDAFGYLDKYGLRFAAINGLSPDAEPSPAHIRELHDLVAAERITTVFSERLVGPEMAQALAGDLGLRTAVLDPIEGLSDSTADEDYLSLMRANLAALRTANGCS